MNEADRSLCEIQGLRAACYKNDKFISFITHSGRGVTFLDPKSNPFHIPVDSDPILIGETAKRALIQSRFLSDSELQDILKKGTSETAYNDFQKKLADIYGYKSKKSMFKNMKKCSISSDKNSLKLMPWRQLTTDTWKGLQDFTIKDIPLETSSSDFGKEILKCLKNSIS